MKKILIHYILFVASAINYSPLKSQTISNVCFAPPTNYSVGGSGIDTGDFNGDGSIDLIIYDNAFSAAILLGSNSGTFTINPTMILGMYDVCIGDFNNDNIDDFAGIYGGGGDDTVRVYFGSSSGAIVFGGKYKAGNFTNYFIETADFNNDGYEDIAAFSTVGEVSVLLGANTGIFTFLHSSTLFPGGFTQVRNICVDDFNNDGNIDIGVPVNNATYIGKYYGNGNGYFPSSGSVLGTNSINNFCISDFNNDGIVDVAATSGQNVMIALNSTSFTTNYYAGLGHSPEKICTADFNGDGYKDLALTNGGANDFAAYLNTGSGTFNAPINISINGNVGSLKGICAADFNNDGRPDVAITGNNNYVSVFLNNPISLVSASSNNDTICQGTSIVLSAIAVGNYTWAASVNTPTASVSPTVTTTYSLVSSNACLTDTAYKTIFVKPSPVISTNTDTVCPGQSFTIVPNGAVTYTYSSGTNVVYPSGTSNYTISGTGLNGCSSSTVSTIYGLLPNITVNDGYVCIGQSYTIVPNGASTYTFSSGTNIVTPSVTTQYTVSGTDLNGCTDSTIVNIAVAPLPQLSVSSGGIVCSGGVTTLSANVIDIGSPSPRLPLSPTTGSGLGDFINSINLATLTNTTGASSSPYYNFYPQTTTLLVGTTYSLVIGAGNFSGDDYAAWIDYNKNGKLDDSGEKIGELDNVGLTLPATITFTFVVPPSAFNGYSRIRIMVTDHTTSNDMNPYKHLSSYGETEDYDIMIQGGQEFSTYSWQPTVNLNSSIIQNPISDVNTTTTYTVNVTQPGCSLSDTSTVYTSPLQAPNLTSTSGSICPGNSFNISPSGAISYTYVNGGPIVSPNSTDIYTILGEDSNGCISSINSTVIVYPIPMINISGISSVCMYSSLDLNATGAITYLWNTGATTSSVSITPTTTSIYTVTGTDLNNCSNTQTVSVVVDNTCADIWPGDANSDGTADNLDVLELGLHYTQTGTPRASVSNAWQSYFANNWTGTITNGKNLNHSDCNGDGTIDDNDTLAIYNNYSLTHAFKPTQTNTVNPQLSIVPDQAYVTKGNWGTASIYLGDGTSPISNINGLAFTVDFDNTLFETNNIYIEYQNSFLDAGQNLRFRKLDFSNGKIFTATTHTVNNNVSGNGKIATLHYQINSNLATDETLNFGITQAAQSNASGTIVPLTSGTATLMAIGASVGIQELNGNAISVSPNPSNGSLTIQSKTELQKIEVMSIDGKILLSEISTNISHTLHLDNFANGIYFVNLYQNNRVVMREKVILNK